MHQLHELYDISVLFDSRLIAKSAWTRTTRSTSAETNISEGQLTALGWFRGEPMPADILDTRLVGSPFAPGGAYVALKLGVMGQHQIRTMFTNPATGESAYPDPWKENALQRVASQLIEKLLASGGKAVVLHKAGGVVKSAAQFRAELGDLTNLETRPFLAWLDLTTTSDESGAIVCRSSGMLHYFGAPDVAAFVASAEEAEAAMQHVVAACERVAAHNANPFTITSVGDWGARFHENHYCLELWPPGVTPPAKTGLLAKLFGPA